MSCVPTYSSVMRWQTLFSARYGQFDVSRNACTMSFLNVDQNFVDGSQNMFLWAYTDKKILVVNNNASELL